MSVAIGGLKKIGSASGGNILLNPTFTTQAALTLYVDPLGSDTNSGTVSGTGAFLTIQAAVNAIPKLVRHPVVVNIATGSYSGFGVYGFSFDPASVTNGAYINFVGGYITATGLASGTATGTATAGAAGSGATYGTLTDGTQAWTINDLKGKAIVITGGTGSGQTRIIASNTATQITIVGTWTAPTGTSTYTISSWGPVVNTAVNQPAIPGTAAGTPLALAMQGNGSVRLVSGSATVLAGAAITFNRIKFAPGTAAQGAVRLNGPNQVAFSECSINGNTSGSGLSSGSYAAVEIDRSYVSSGTGIGLNSLASNFASQYVQMNCVLIETGGAGTPMTLQGAGSITSVQANANANTSTSVSQLSGNFIMTGCVLQGTAGGSTVGLNLLSAVAGLTPYNTGVIFTSSSILSCPVGVNASGSTSNVFLGAGTVITGTGAQTSGIAALRGGRVDLAEDPTITGYTNDLTLDGVNYAYATMSGATPPVITSTSYCSWIGK